MHRIVFLRSRVRAALIALLLSSLVYGGALQLIRLAETKTERAEAAQHRTGVAALEEIESARFLKLTERFLKVKGRIERVAEKSTQSLNTDIVPKETHRLVMAGEKRFARRDYAGSVQVVTKLEKDAPALETELKTRIAKEEQRAKALRHELLLKWRVAPFIAANPKYGARIPILYYHHVSPNPAESNNVYPAEFEAQMEWLSQNGYNTITPDQLSNFMRQGTALPEKPVLITFDDGYADNFYYADPILRKYNLKATVYLATDLLGACGGWYLCWDQVKEMARGSVWTLGAHTLRHVGLAGVRTSTAKQEITESKKKIEAMTGTTITAFCYPYGSFNSAVIDMVFDAAYTTAVSTISGTWQSPDNLYSLHRTKIGHIGIAGFKKALGP